MQVSLCVGCVVIEKPVTLTSSRPSCSYCYCWPGTGSGAAICPDSFVDSGTV